MSAFLCDLCGHGEDSGHSAHVKCCVPGRRPWVKPKILMPDRRPKHPTLICYDFEWKEANVEMEHATV